MLSEPLNHNFGNF